MAWLYWALDWDFEASSRELELALELGPSDPEAHIQAALLGVVEDRERAFAHAELALRLDPLSESTHFQLAWCYYFGAEPARALEQSRKTLERFPESLQTWYVLGLSRLSLGQAHEGVTALEKATSLSREPVGLGYLGCAYTLVGRQEDARAILDELLARKTERFVPLKPFILLYTALGDIDRALDALEDAYRTAGSHPAGHDGRAAVCEAPGSAPVRGAPGAARGAPTQCPAARADASSWPPVTAASLSDRS